MLQYLSDEPKPLFCLPVNEGIVYKQSLQVVQHSLKEIQLVVFRKKKLLGQLRTGEVCDVISKLSINSALKQIFKRTTPFHLQI